MLRLASDEKAAGMLQEALDKEFVRPLATRMGGEDAELRAGMVAADLLGVMVAREVVRRGPLAQAGPERLVAHLAPVLQSHIDGRTARTNHRQQAIPDDTGVRSAFLELRILRLSFGLN